MTGKGAFKRGAPFFGRSTLLHATVANERSERWLSVHEPSKGEVTEVLLGTVTALITVKVGDDMVESVITERSAKN